MSKRSVWGWLSMALATGTLAGCGLPGGVREARPQPQASPEASRPVTLVKASGDTVTVDDQRSGSPVELRLDQQLVVRLHYDATSAAQWELSDFVAGALAKPGPSRFETPNGEKALLLGGDQIWRFKPAVAGQTLLRFEYRAPRSREVALQSVTFAVTVR